MPATPDAMTLPQRGWTVDRLLALPEDRRRYECVDGELFVTPAPRRLHQVVLWALMSELQPYIAQHRIGRLGGAPADIHLDAQTLVQPDLFVEPLGIPADATWPDVRGLLLVIEILSPSTARADRRVKRSRYQRAGIPVYWIVDIDARLVEVWTPEAAGPAIVDDVLTWHPEPAAAPFALALPAFFETLLGAELDDSHR